MIFLKRIMSIPTNTKTFVLLLLSTVCLFADIHPGEAATKSVDILAAPPTVSPKVTTYQFASCLDGKDDFYSLCPSQALQPSGVLLVYFHSFTGNFKELFKSDLADTINKTFPSLNLLSCNYGSSPSWGSAIARIDITNNLRQVMKKTTVNHIVLVGTSMGASAALAYAATAPDYIRHRIRGIVAVAPCSELADLYQQSMAPTVKPTLEAALGGNATDKAGFYHQNSLDSCLSFLPQPIKIAVITAKDDTLVPMALQMDVVRDLNNRDINAKVFELEGKSEPPPTESIMEGLHFVLQ